MKKLLIVESPAKIKTIAKFLNRDFKIMSTMGHIKDLPTKTLGVAVNGGITIEYVPLAQKEKVIADLCKEASHANEIFLALDNDREGEIIAWHVAREMEKVLKKDTTIYRISFNEITKQAIDAALAHPAFIDEKKVNAQQARRVLDRWVGYEVSPILWKKIASGLSAGRVQSVGLRLICDREEAIRAFKPEKYWTIDGTFEWRNGGSTEKVIAPLVLVNKKKPTISDKKKADTLIADITKESYHIDAIEDKKRSKHASPPFMTSSLQQAAYNQLGFSVKKTMQLAQQLYEGVALDDDKSPVALITYMRTDSLRIADLAVKQARSYIKSHFDARYLPESATVFAKKGKSKTVVQDAHEAIRPVDVAVAPSFVKKYVSADLAKLYELIWKRFVACQMKAAEYNLCTVTIQGGPFTFRVSGSTLLFDGFLAVYAAVDDDDKDEKVILPPGLKEKLSLTLANASSKEHTTQPPPRYTEASLVKELEKEGIGRPSTYATILNTIRERSYTTLDSKKRFVPTELGMTVTKMLVDNLPHIMSPQFTAVMEEDLDKIAHGVLERDTLLHEFYNAFQKDLEAFRGLDGAAKKQIVTTDLSCPTCTKPLVIRFGKSGEFIGCSGFPECTFTSNFKRSDDGSIELVAAEKVAMLEEKCPVCSKNLRRMPGRYGTFDACSGYPECTYIKKEKAPFSCPLCKKEVHKRLWKGGSFWGCSGYPQCKFALFDEYEMIPCPSCKWPFMTVKKSDDQAMYACANKECTQYKGTDKK